MRKRIAIAGAVIGTTAGIGIGRVVRTWRTWGIDPDEKTKVLAGDELVARPSAIETRAITVDAPPEAVWPWLTQMGFEIAEKVGITMIGRATNKHFLLFTGGERFRSER